ncbi:MAG: 50S ribosomal protein L19 [Acetilactobacillus jinshanensis]
MRQNKLIAKINSKQTAKKVPTIRIGDTVEVAVKVTEGKTTRIQLFDGVVIKKHGSGIQSDYTVRRTSGGVGVERVFPLYSPVIASVKVLRHGRVRRAKLYYLRHLSGKAARIGEARRH